MSYGDYLRNKVQKLHEQADKAETYIFQGCNIYITGHTKPPLQELRRLITTNGGLHAQYFTGTKTVSHIISSGMTARKRDQFAKFKVVKPEWIVDCVKQGKLISWTKYRTIPLPPATNRLDADTTGDSRAPKRIESCLDPGFIASFYSRSRLHHLSTWKSELKIRFQTCFPTNSRKNHRNRLVMHVDFDSFFVSVALQKRPELADKPVCVSNGGDAADVASCNYVARISGVKNGMWIQKAKNLCPDLISLPYNFKDYETASTALYQVLSGLNPEVFYPVSVDEAIVDITAIAPTAEGEASEEEMLEFARDIRFQIQQAAGIEASIGIGPNVLAAKIALRLAKPGGQVYLTGHKLYSELTELPVMSLPGVGRNINAKLGSEIQTVDDIRSTGELKLQELLGAKLGTKLWNYSHGIDNDWEWLYSGNEPKTVGVDISWGIRFSTPTDVDTFLSTLSSELNKRYKRTGCRVLGITAKILIRAPGAPIDPPKYLGCGECNASSTFRVLTKIEGLFNTAKVMVHDLIGSHPVTDVRGIGLTLKLFKVANKIGTLSGFSSRPRSNITLDDEYKSIEIQFVREWMESGHLPQYEDVCLIEKYILSSHWTRGYELLRWMRLAAPNGEWQTLVDIYTEKLNEKLCEESLGYVDI